MTLVCLHHAGGSAAAFAGWQRELAPFVEVALARLPGRGGRLHEAPVTSMEALLGGLVPAIEGLPPRPLALFGHSMGALVAFELARVLEERGIARLLVLHLAGASPRGRSRLGPVSSLSDPEVLSWLERWGGVPEYARTEPGILRMLLPTLRADLEVVQGYEPSQDARIATPIHAIAGRQDRLAPLARVAEWRGHTRGGFRAAVLNGGHFFPRSARRELLRLIAADRARRLPSLPERGREDTAVEIHGVG